MREDQFQDHLRNLNVHKYKGPDGMHARVLKKLADAVVKTLFIMSEKPCQSSAVPRD